MAFAGENRQYVDFAHVCYEGASNNCGTLLVLDENTLDGVGFYGYDLEDGYHPLNPSYAGTKQAEGPDGKIKYDSATRTITLDSIGGINELAYIEAMASDITFEIGGTNYLARTPLASDVDGRADELASFVVAGSVTIKEQSEGSSIHLRGGKAGIYIADDASLTIESGTISTLAPSGSYKGICGNDIEVAGTLDIKGGTITLNGNTFDVFGVSYDAGISGSTMGVSGTLNLNGGTLNMSARENHGANLDIYEGGEVNINGGTMLALGKSEVGVRSLGKFNVNNGGTATISGEEAAFKAMFLAETKLDTKIGTTPANLALKTVKDTYNNSYTTFSAEEITLDGSKLVGAATQVTLYTIEPEEDEEETEGENIATQTTDEEESETNPKTFDASLLAIFAGITTVALGSTIMVLSKK